LTEEQNPKAEERMRVILDHLAGTLTATQAALDLGVSRKTFYEWLERATEAMRSALMDRPGGRPPNPVDPEKERLQDELKSLEKEREVLEGRLRIQEAIRQTFEELQNGSSPPKKKRETRADGRSR
jgi:transposase